MQTLSPQETTLLKLEMGLSVALAFNVIASLALSFSLHLSSYLAVMLTVTAFGVLAVRFRILTLYGFFIFYHFVVSAVVGYVTMTSSHIRSNGWPLAVTILYCCTCLAILIEALHIMRTLRIAKLAEQAQQNASADLESQETELSPILLETPHSSPQTPTPIFIAVPAYYPHYNGDQPGFAQFEAGAGHYIPHYVDASGKPIAPIN